MRYLLAAVCSLLLGHSALAQWPSSVTTYNPSYGWNTYQVTPSYNGYTTWSPGTGFTNYTYGPNGNVSSWNAYSGFTNYTRYSGGYSAWNPQTGFTNYSTWSTPSGGTTYNYRTGQWTYYYRR